MALGADGAANHRTFAGCVARIDVDGVVLGRRGGVAERGDEAAAIETGGRGEAGEFNERRVNVHGLDERAALRTGLRPGRGDEQGDARGLLVVRVLPALAGLVIRVLIIRTRYL